MKKSLAIITICFLTITVKAQSNTGSFKIPPMPPTMIMPDSSVVPTQSQDSVRKVFGGRELTFSFIEDKLYVHPAATKAERLESETKLNSLLNKPAPAFAFKDINGKLYSLPDLKGKIVVLNFWYTQCGGCIMEMPDLNGLKQSYSDKNVVFLAITFDDSNKINAFLTKNKFDYTIIPNAKKVCTDYKLFGYPTSVVIDQNGIVKFVNCSIDANIKSDLSKAIDDAKNNS